MTDIVGKQLKDFFVLRRLGRGAMAEVYLAQQLSLGRQVALKVLNAELARDPNYVRRFDHEARAAAALVHGSIIQIYEVGQHDGVHYIAQEYVPGRNLGEVIRSSGSLTPQLALDIIRQVTAALAKASSEGIVHRDIKPENIMLARSGEVKVADFGLARVAGDGAVQLTQVGVTMGTPLYMSPEQIEGKPLDSRSDIYSLGVTAYHMLAGEPPFIGETPLSVAVQHLNQQSTPLVTRRPDVPPKLATLIERMMAKNPADRPSDPADLLVDVHTLATEGAQEGWAATPDPASLTQILVAADQRSTATTRLDSLMKTMALPRPQRAKYGWWIAGILGCLLAGAAIGAATSPRSLWSGAKVAPPQQDTVWGQLYLAKDVDTEAAWEAVADYFPDASANALNLGKQGLAFHFLHQAEYGKAIKPLQELAAQPDFQTFAEAGLVVAYVNLGDNDHAYEENKHLSSDKVAALRRQSPTMAAMLDDAVNELIERAL
ncbi:MAG TPA: serine/threonine-protein kinase [Lacipirellulaceae bacterium]|jgi:serine/threonine-protein kinase|nr:serine/threonine-protein kinase [Lacipirellulaceae bacterium]